MTDPACGLSVLVTPQALPIHAASKDVIVSALVLNFLPEKVRALVEMKRVARTGCTIGCYVWDYPSGGVEFLDAFWTAATALDPGASELDEKRRFPFCTIDGLIDLANNAGLGSLDATSIVIPTTFKDFDDFWQPFTLGAGPAPGYCSGLAPEARQRLKDALFEALPRHDDGSIHLEARAWAVKGSSI